MRDRSLPTFPHRARQEVAVFAGAEPLAAWVFTPEANRGVRQLRLPVGRSTLVEFRPSYAVAPDAEEAASTDRRALAMALYRLRDKRKAFFLERKKQRTFQREAASLS